MKYPVNPSASCRVFAPKIIYDFGMNNGDDVAYYLRKGFKVVGVEANPDLCDHCLNRFRSQVESGDLVILNVAVADESTEEKVLFYVHKEDHVLGQLSKPPESILEQFSQVLVPQRKASEIVQEYGIPYYIKIDIEHFDHIVLADLFKHDIVPEFISAESHSVKVLALLVTAGYRSFNLVEGSAVRWTYAETEIVTPNGIEKHEFKHHSAGPFGEDLSSPWVDEDALFSLLCWKGLGWVDIHATTVIPPAKRSGLPEYPKLPFRGHLKDLVPSLFRAIKRRLYGRNSMAFQKVQSPSQLDRIAGHDNNAT